MTMTRQMPDAFERLRKIIALEKRQGYRNKAVIGGLDKFANRWEQDARQEAPERSRIIHDIVTLLSSYPDVAEQDARARILSDILSRLSDETAERPAAPAAKPQEPNPARPQRDRADLPPQREAVRPAAGAAGRPPRREPPPPTAPRENRERMPKTRSGRAPAWPAPPPSAQPAAAGSAPKAPSERHSLRRIAKPLSASEMDLGLQAPVTSLPSIGPHYATLLANLNIGTVEDMLWHFPRRYVDYSTLKPIAALQRGDEVTVLGTVWEVGERHLRSGNKATVAIVADASGTLQVMWYNPYVIKQLKTGRLIALSGKIDLYMGRFVLTNPEFESLDEELVHTGRLVPVYPLTTDLKQRWLRQRVKQAVDAWAPRTVDFVPDRILAAHRLMPLARALQQIHFPDDGGQLEEARRRLAFDELFLIQLGMLRQRQRWQGRPAQPLPLTPDAQQRFRQALPFTLTAAQEAALAQILHDLQEERPMSRLLQGDVGSGKTVVAAAAMWTAVANRTQAALMAPTEILAEQHFRSLTTLFAGMSAADEAALPPVRVALLTGSLKESDKEEIRRGLAEGDIDVVVGTHALIQESVQFARLGLAIVDEQHRFGVEQRAELKQRAQAGDESLTPHLLVMSATPIPRSLALTLYGDLDLSIIDELPPGRQSIKTYVLHPTERERAYGFIERQVEAGRQAYVICPLVEESEQSDARAAVAEHERLQSDVFPQFRLGLLHGRLKAEEKEGAMHAFADNETQILVSTSVVEVGIDVPNATVMLVEGANRFGLAQLHQFRGRVGRGEHLSYCLLQVERADQTEDERLAALAETTDGFKLAELDLQLRGPGDFFGTRQSGLPPLRMAAATDMRLLDLARQEAQALLALDPALELPEHQALSGKTDTFWRGRGDVS